MIDHAPTADDDFRFLCEEWLQTDEIIQRWKTYRSFIISAVRAKLRATGKHSWKDNDFEIEARLQYILGCYECGIDIRECGHGQGARLGDVLLGAQLTKISLPDDQRWIAISRRDEQKPKRVFLSLIPGGAEEE